MKTKRRKQPPEVSGLPLDQQAYQEGYCAAARGRAYNPPLTEIVRHDSYFVGYEAAKRAIRLDLDPRIETKTVRRVRVKRK